MAAGLAACAREPQEPLPPRRLSLAEFASAARPVVETDRFDLGEAAARSALWSGWGADEKSPEGTFVWAGAESSLLRLEVVEPRDRVLELRGWSFPFHDDPPQEVRLLLNGREIGNRLIGVAPSLTRVTVSASIFQVGENYLELRYRRHHDQPGDNPWAAGWSDLALSDSRREAGAPPQIGARDGTIDLPTRTALEWALELPPDSWLAWGALESEGPARLVARVTSEERSSGEERRIDHGAGQLRLTPADDRHHLINLSLASLGANGRVRLRDAAIHMPLLATLEAPAPAVVAAAPRASRPNVVVYLIDTLRADHLGCYGYSKPTSPEIDRFAQQAVRWQEGRAQSSWTRPAVATILTGLQPITHGVQESFDKLSERVPLISEMFGRAGWQTAMFTSNGNVASRFGFARGWDFYRYFPERRRTPELHVQSVEMHPGIVDWLEHRDRSKPFLVVVHTTDPHHPYTPMRRFRKLLATSVRDRETGSRADISRLPSLPPAVAVKRRDDLMALYDAEIAGNDASFGKLMDYLDRAGLRETTAVLLVSDHGEEFYEHGGWTHGLSLYEEQLRVPFVLRLPGGRGAGTVVPADVAEQIDVVPTLLGLAGLPVPKELPGRDLLAAPSIPEREAAGRSSFAWLQRTDQALDAVSRSQWKLVRNERANPALHRPPRELYALGSDPGEQNDLARVRPLRRAWLEGHLLAAWVRFQRLLPVERTALDPELEANLRALGYL
jgi:arylsulfatase A-like enzyme